MSETCKTVAIATDNGAVAINESDFDPAIHKLHVEKEPTAAELKAAEKAAKKEAEAAEKAAAEAAEKTGG